MGETTATRREVWVLKIWKNIKLVTIRVTELCLGGVYNYASKRLVYTYSNDEGDILI